MEFSCEYRTGEIAETGNFVETLFVAARMCFNKIDLISPKLLYNQISVASITHAYSAQIGIRRPIRLYKAI